MREILFRGKRVDNNEWVYGYPIKANLHWHKFGIHEDWIVTKAVQNGGLCNVVGKYAVIPETVGQYTGIKDKNGKKIFDGDCIGCRYNVVEYLDGTFTINGDRPLSWLKGTKDFKVIGNIFDKESDNDC